MAETVPTIQERLRPMVEARKDGTSVLAKLRQDLAAFTGQMDNYNIKGAAGRWVVVRHPGLADDGFDMGWNLAGPFGNGGWPDNWFDGFVPLPDDASYRALLPPTAPDSEVHNDGGMK